MNRLFDGLEEREADMNMDFLVKQNSAQNLIFFKVCFYLTMVSNLIIYIAQPFDLTVLIALASRCYMLCSFGALCYTVFNSFRRYVPYKSIQILTIIFMVSFALVSYLLSNSSGMYQWIVRLLCYLALPVYLLYLDYLKPDKWTLHFIFLLSVIASLFFAALSFSSLRYAGYENYVGTSGAWMTLGYENPNQTAMYLLVTQIILLGAFYYYSKKSIRFLLFADVMYMGWLIIQTSSRTCIMISVLILVIGVLRKKFNIQKYIVTAILILPLLFFVLYPYLFGSGPVNSLEIVGKTDYSARGEIFRSAFTSVSNRFLLGDFSKYQLENLHNGPLSVYASLGLIGLIIFYIYYLRAYYRILSYGFQCQTAFIAFLGLLSVFIHSCTESSFLTGGAMYAGSLSVLILLTRTEGRERH